MPRPHCCRRVAGAPVCTLFKPAGTPGRSLAEVVLQVDELEAIRLADLEGRYQEDAAVLMNVSRQTFGRIVESARRKVAEALIQGKALRIEGGTVQMTQTRTFTCQACRNTWEVPFGTGRPEGCPQCRSASFHRSGPRGWGAGAVAAAAAAPLAAGAPSALPGPGAGRRRCFRGGR